MPLYKAAVQPHLDYCIQFLLLYLKKGTAGLEKVQVKGTSKIRGLEHLSYEESLESLGPQSRKKDG